MEPEQPSEEPHVTVELVEHSYDTGVVQINYAEGPATGPPLTFLHGGSGR